MPQQPKSDNGLSIARVTVQAADCQDSGMGVVVALRPLALLVPSHLIELVEQDEALTILVNGIPHQGAKILPTVALQRDHLSILQFHQNRLRDLKSAHLPKHTVQLITGQSVSLQRLEPESTVKGRIVDVQERGDGSSVVTDIEVASGDSGSPLLVSGKLAAVCQGMIQHDDTGTAVAVPLSHDSLSELRKLRFRYRISLLSVLAAALLAVAVLFGVFGVYSSNTFALASIEVPEEGSMILARNAHALTLRPTWSRSFDTQVLHSLAFSSDAGGGANHVAVGTAYADGIDGTINMLNSNGNILWTYSVPDGECIYSTAESVYDGYLVDVIHIADLNEDGSNEILVSFVHNNFGPCKLVVFDLSGGILAEYWHPGYIRTIATGRVGEANEVLVVISASNNALASTWWNPQTLFAFRGLDIAGHAPPYYYQGTAERIDLSPGTEIWYQVIVNIDPGLMRAKCYQFEIGDYTGDEINEIQAALTDGRFYYLDESGAQIRVSVGDRFLKEFPDVNPPSLVDVWEYRIPADINE